MATKYLVCLCGAMDDMPVVLLDTKDDVLKFVTDNPPLPVDGGDCVLDGPLADACQVNECGPSIVYGYKVYVFEGNKPVGLARLRWVTGEWPGPDELAKMSSDEYADWFAGLHDDLL